MKRSITSINKLALNVSGLLKESIYFSKQISTKIIGFVFLLYSCCCSRLTLINLYSIAL